MAIYLDDEVITGGLDCPWFFFILTTKCSVIFFVLKSGSECSKRIPPSRLLRILLNPLWSQNWDDWTTMTGWDVNWVNYWRRVWVWIIGIRRSRLLWPTPPTSKINVRFISDPSKFKEQRF